MKKCIFVAGIHGVGKTTFSNKLKSKLNIAHYSASQLIRDFDPELFFADKRVTDIENNQDVLINSIIQNVPENFYILDGHFTLLKKDNAIEKIPKDTFKKLGITKTILLLEQPIIIHHRIKKRDNNKFLTLDEIDKMQQYELMHAKEVCDLYNIQLVTLNSSIDVEKYLDKEMLV